MRILAISGTARAESTNTALLTAMRDIAAPRFAISVFQGLGALPVFSPDLEGERTPAQVLHFLDLVSATDGIIIASPEYVRAIPGGLKNAIDWMVSRFEIIGKPIALAHASHRGDDMLSSLRRVLSTVSSGFQEENFLRIPLLGKTREDIASLLRHPDHEKRIMTFLSRFAAGADRHSPRSS